jgi:hypothetical protein
MSKPNRDLLVLFNQELMTPQAIEHEVGLLHELLCMVESIDSLVTAHELIDLNKYKITNKRKVLHDIFYQHQLKPFLFLNCKN